MKHSLISSIATVIALAVVVFAISAFFISNERMIGFVLLALFLLCMVSLIPFGIALRSIQPDIIFGVIDNGILVVFALIGGKVAGIPGAIVGGAVGNAVTDGIAGIFEGYWAERLRKRNVSDHRTIIGSAIGKMGGCLLGAGGILIIVSFLKAVLP